MWFKKKSQFDVVYCCSDFLKSMWIQSGYAKNIFSNVNSHSELFQHYKAAEQRTPETCMVKQLA